MPRFEPGSLRQNTDALANSGMPPLLSLNWSLLVAVLLNFKLTQRESLNRKTEAIKTSRKF
jgi:hypothetical protein